MEENLEIDCPICQVEFNFLFDGDLDSVSNNDVDVVCSECCSSFTISVVSEVTYSLQIESFEKEKDSVTADMV